MIYFCRFFCWLCIVIGSLFVSPALSSPIVLSFDVEITPYSARRYVLTPYSFTTENLLQPIILTPFNTTARYVTEMGKIKEYLSPSPYTAQLLSGAKNLNYIDQASEVVYYGQLGDYGYTLGQINSNSIYDLFSDVERYHQLNISFASLDSLESNRLLFERILGEEELNFLLKPFDNSETRYIGWTEDVRTYYRGTDDSNWLQDEIVITGSVRIISTFISPLSEYKQVPSPSTGSFLLLYGFLIFRCYLVKACSKWLFILTNLKIWFFSKLSQIGDLTIKVRLSERNEQQSEQIWL